MPVNQSIGLTGKEFIRDTAKPENTEIKKATKYTKLRNKLISDGNYSDLSTATTYPIKTLPETAKLKTFPFNYGKIKKTLIRNASE